MKTILIILGVAVVGGVIYFFVGVPMIKKSLAKKIKLAEKNYVPKNGIGKGIALTEQELADTKSIKELQDILNYFKD